MADATPDAPFERQSLDAAIARLEASGALRRVPLPAADLDEASAVAAAVDAKHRAATLFAGGLGEAKPALLAGLAGDRRRLAALFDAPEGELLPTLLRRLAAPIAPRPAADAGAPADATVDLDRLDLPLPAAAGILALPGGAGRDEALLGLVPAEVEARAEASLRALPFRQRALLEAGPRPAALVLGAHPACLAGAALSAAEGGDGWRAASSLLGEALAMARDGAVTYPAASSMVLIGKVALDDGGQARLEVERVRRGKQSTLHLLASRLFALERLRFEALGIELAVARHLRNVEGGLDIVDVRALAETENRVVVVKLRPRMEGQAKTALMAALSSPEMHPVLAIAVDEDIDIDDPRDVGWAVASRLHAEYDLAQLTSLPVPSRSGAPDARAKWLIDATMPPPTQPQRRQAFERATPKNLRQVRLEDFLPD